MKRAEDHGEVDEVAATHIYGWAYRLLQDHHDALDATQEVLLRWVAGGRSARNRRAWLRRTTINHCIDLLRLRRRRIAAFRDEVLIDKPDFAPARRELHLAIADSLHRLPRRQRDVIVAKVYDHQTFAAIADDMGISVSTVKTHYVRALAALREPLKAYVELD